MSEIQENLRLDSRATGIQYSNIKFADLPKEDEDLLWEKLNKLKETHTNDIITTHMNSGSTIDDVQILYDNLIDQRINIGLIILDYIGDMSPSTDTGESVYDNKSQGVIVRETKDFASNNNIPVWSAQQLNRKSAEKEKAGTENISNSDIYGARSDLILAVLRSEEDEILRQIRIQVMKYRDGKGKIYTYQELFHIMSVGENINKQINYKDKFKKNEKQDKRELKVQEFLINPQITENDFSRF